MRPIKFRAWDSYEEVMLSFEELKALDSEGTAYFDVLSGNYQDLKPMQFTGLKDKNGKEIYEGDLLYSEPITLVNDPDDKWIVPVVYNEASFCYGDIEGVGHPLDENECAEEMEVIGNVFENPELLNDGKAS